MDALGDAFTDVVIVIATTALGHFGVEVDALEPAAARERPAVQRTSPVKATRPGPVSMQRPQRAR